MRGRVIQHGRTHAIPPPRTLQDVIIDATRMLRRAATFPISLVVRQLGKSDRHVTQRRIDLHHGTLARQPEQFGMRPPQARKRKGRLLDAGGQMMTPELLYDNQSRIGHIFLVSPTFDITKPGKFFFIAFAGQSYDSLAFLHLRGQIFMRTGSYPEPLFSQNPLWSQE